jgi:hypothetical protein
VRNSSGVGVGTGVGENNLSGLGFYCLIFCIILGLKHISISVQGNL